MKKPPLSGRKHYRFGVCLRWLLTITPERLYRLTRTVMGDRRLGLQVQAIRSPPFLAVSIGGNEKHYSQFNTFILECQYFVCKQSMNGTKPQYEVVNRVELFR